MPVTTDGERAAKLAELEALACEIDCEEPAMLDILARYAELLEREGRTRRRRQHLIPLP